MAFFNCDIRVGKGNREYSSGSMSVATLHMFFVTQERELLSLVNLLSLCWCMLVILHYIVTYITKKHMKGSVLK
jgi:hypothetical protein